MKKETQKEHIERLKEEISVQLEANNMLQKQIYKMQYEANEQFGNSGDFIQMKKKIENLKTKVVALEDSVKHNRKMYTFELNKNDKLIKRLRENKEVQKFKNERGAGRKSKFTDKEITEIKMNSQKGKTIKEIAEMFSCSVGLIHKLISEIK
ncbi:Hin recombinase [Clostridium gasigenes]|uniref:Hin recombinase n=1 Tax=Clostridium gasigenes TaxID=94869 RepID=UPI001C0D20EF|nr:Hin recombinase [Clostridium gasigenes]MBU3087450.1 Hin recombinase [Clostridium gasigenes]